MPNRVRVGEDDTISVRERVGLISEMKESRPSQISENDLARKPDKDYVSRGVVYSFRNARQRLSETFFSKDMPIEKQPAGYLNEDTKASLGELATAGIQKRVVQLEDTNARLRETMDRGDAVYLEIDKKLKNIATKQEEVRHLLRESMDGEHDGDKV